MKNRKVVFGLAAVVSCVALAAAFLVLGPWPVHQLIAAAGLLLVGITVTYTYPVAGATAPTAAQARNRSMITGTIIMADGDTQVAVTHNWGLSAAELTDRFPWSTWNYVTPGTSPALVSWSRTSNVITFQKASGTGTGGTYEFTLERPHSIIR
jgi:hypothetical protein